MCIVDTPTYHTQIRTLTHDWHTLVHITGATHSYIVACPRVAVPYDKATQEARYPSERYYITMTLVAVKLVQITELFSSRIPPTRPGRGRLKVKVGISSGPVACVVLGLIKRFYCLYGTTVNFSARLAR